MMVLDTPVTVHGLPLDSLGWGSPEIVETEKRQYNLFREDTYGQATQNVHP